MNDDFVRTLRNNTTKAQEEIKKIKVKQLNKELPVILEKIKSKCLKESNKGETDTFIHYSDVPELKGKDLDLVIEELAKLGLKARNESYTGLGPYLYIDWREVSF